MEQVHDIIGTYIHQETNASYQVVKITNMIPNNAITKGSCSSVPGSFKYRTSCGQHVNPLNGEDVSSFKFVISEKVIHRIKG